MDTKIISTFFITLFVTLSLTLRAAESIHDLKFENLKGKNIDFKKYKGQVLLIVNTASKCGYTPQLKGLQGLHTKYQDKGLKVLGFPSNDFNQEDMDGKKLQSFCMLNYGVDFPMFSKSNVTGAKKNKLYQILTPKHDVKWNFEKLLVGKDGKLIARFPSSTTPFDKKLLAKLEMALRK